MSKKEFEATWLWEDANGNELEEPIVVLCDGRVVRECGGVDWKATPEEVFDTLHDLAAKLQPHEELVKMDDQSDTYWFGIVTKKE